MSKPLVGIIMGSSSDWDVMKNAVDMLKQFGVPYEAQVISAHRKFKTRVESSFESLFLMALPKSSITLLIAAVSCGFEVYLPMYGGGLSAAIAIPPHNNAEASAKPVTKRRIDEIPLE